MAHPARARLLLWSVPLATLLFATPAAPADRLSGTVEFDGGTVGEYVELVRKTWAGYQGSIVMDLGVAEIPAPPISLKEVEISTALNVLSWTQAARKRHLNVKPLGDDVFVITAEAAPNTVASAAKPTAAEFSSFLRVTPEVVSTPERVVVRVQHPEQAWEQESHLRIFPLRRILDDEEGSLDSTLQAINAALQLGDAGTEKAKLSLHQDSGLLMVRGNEPQVEIVERVVRAMGDWEPEEEQEEAHHRREMEELLQVMGTNPKNLEAELERRERHLRELMEDELHERWHQLRKSLEDELAKREEERDTLMLKIETLSGAVKDLQAEVRRLLKAQAEGSS